MTTQTIKTASAGSLHPLVHRGLLPGLHPTHVTEIVRSVRGCNIKLTASVSQNWCEDSPWIDVWGQLEGSGNPLYPPRDPDKSIAKYGGVEGYKNSPARGLFHYITLGQYLSLRVRALNHFYPRPRL